MRKRNKMTDREKMFYYLGHLRVAFMYLLFIVAYKLVFVNSILRKND